MAAVLNLRLTDGTTTVNLGDGTTGYVLGYTPGSPASASSATGGSPVTERAVVLFLGGLAAIRTTLESVGALLAQAELYQEKQIGARVWIERQVDDTDIYWRSEVLEGAVIFGEDTLDENLVAGKMEFTIAWKRRNYWEGYEVALPLTNGNGTRQVSLTVYGVDDSQTGKDNWVDLTGTDLLGDIPGATRIEVTNTYNNAGDTTDVFLALNKNSTPASFNHVLEGESGTGGTTKPSTPDYTVYSNGRYSEFSVGTTQARALYWTLSSTQLGYAAGNDFRMVVKFSSAPESGTWVRPRVTVDSVLTIWEGPWILLSSSGLQEIGTVRLPPGLLSGMACGLRLELYFKRPAGGVTMGIDFLHLYPTDGWRKLVSAGFNLSYALLLVDDGFCECVYLISGSGSLTSYIGYGEQIKLWPGVNQRLFVTTAGSNQAVRTSSVRVYYRPRRITL